MTPTIALRQMLALGLTLLVLMPALAAQGETKAEKTVAYGVDKAIPLDSTVGPVKITTLRITDLGRGYGRGGLSLRSVRPPSELTTTLRFAFEVNNPIEEEWDVTFTVDLLDREGKVIDRASKTENYEEEAAVLTIEHPLIEYALPLVSQVKVSLQGRKS